jgi:VIT1/CCC1 family predicted Fe2+/Mn2+ transporter
MMKEALKKGIGFGLTSGVITTLGLMVGLHSGTHLKVAVVAGILTIAIADAFSDALGMHISEESVNQKTTAIWEATISTFAAKFIFAMTFILPVILFQLNIAIIVSIAWGLFLLPLFSFYIAKTQNTNPFHVVSEHLLIAIIVITITHLVGDWIRATFT